MPYLEIDEPDIAATYFRQSYANIHSLFNVWQRVNAESIDGAPNFITGAGGFLQGITFGYGGLRIQQGRLLANPQLPPDTAFIRLRQIAYLGNSLDLVW